MSVDDQGSQRADRYVQIARAVAAGASQLLPQGFEARESNGDIAISVPECGRIGLFGVQSALMYLPVPVVTLEDVARNAEGLLNWLQDFVSEHFHDVWPPAEGLAEGQSPRYRAEAQASGIRLWFEVNGTPVTRVIEVPIDLLPPNGHR